MVELEIICLHLRTDSTLHVRLVLLFHSHKLFIIFISSFLFLKKEKLKLRSPFNWEIKFVISENKENFRFL